MAARLAVALIIPAYNEEHRIGRVIRAALATEWVDEVIVVSDGSTDGTVQVAQSIPGISVLDLRDNLGKGGAMAAGARMTQAPVLAFLDADLEGLEPSHIDEYIAPVAIDFCDMCVGIFKGGKVLSDTAQFISPFLSGQRAMRRELFEAVPFIQELRMGVEVAINHTARKRHARIARVVLRGVSNVHKEEKYGFVKGMAERTRMYGEIAEAMVRSRVQSRNRVRKKEYGHWHR